MVEAISVGESPSLDMVELDIEMKIFRSIRRGRGLTYMKCNFVFAMASKVAARAQVAAEFLLPTPFSLGPDCLLSFFNHAHVPPFTSIRLSRIVMVDFKGPVNDARC